MPRDINSYTLKELCNEHEAIILSTPAGDEILIENYPKGTGFYLFFGGKIKPIDDLGHYMIVKDSEPTIYELVSEEKIKALQNALKLCLDNLEAIVSTKEFIHKHNEIFEFNKMRELL